MSHREVVGERCTENQTHHLRSFPNPSIVPDRESNVKVVVYLLILGMYVFTLYPPVILGLGTLCFRRAEASTDTHG